jgi:hypothetical protein
MNSTGFTMIAGGFGGRPRAGAAGISSERQSLAAPARTRLVASLGLPGLGAPECQ